MIYEEVTSESRTRRTLTGAARVLFALKIDGPLVTGLALICAFGLVVLYSASGQNIATVLRTVLRIVLGTAAMLVLARVNPNFLRRSAPWLFAIGMFLLIVVDAIGYIGKGAQRWLDLGIVKFQPSELMKLAVPMICAWYLHERPLPPTWTSLTILAGIILLPVGLVAMQPDLGTAALIAIAGVLVIIMAGLPVRVMVVFVLLGAAAAWFGWNFMHDYQRKRVLESPDAATDDLSQVVARCSTFAAFARIYPALRSDMSSLLDTPDGGTMDFIARLEDLDRDMETIARRLEIPAALPSENRSEHASYREYYDDETRAIVAGHFARDIARFGYAF